MCAGDQAFRGHLAAATLLQFALGQVAADCALIATHEQDVLLLRDAGEPFADGIAGAEAEQVVVKEEDAGDVGTVVALFQLGKDHGGELSGAREVGSQDVCNFHRVSVVVR